MSRKRKLTPSYLLHQQSSRGRLVWTYLMVAMERMLPGPFDSTESLTAKRGWNWRLPPRRPCAARRC